MWWLRNLGYPAYQKELNAQFAVALFVVTTINVLVLAVIVFRRRWTGWSGLVLAAMQVGNIVASLWASLDRDNFGWLALGGMPAAAILLLIFLLRKVETHQVTGVEGTGPE